LNLVLGQVWLSWVFVGMLRGLQRRDPCLSSYVAPPPRAAYDATSHTAGSASSPTDPSEVSVGVSERGTWHAYVEVEQLTSDTVPWEA
jgi:hypothetical protein